MAIKAIPTRYKGYHFRSRLEARWAVFLDSINADWSYEPEGYELPSGKYLPDFLVKTKSRYRGDFFLEIKPSTFIRHSFFMCGKMNGWRRNVNGFHYYCSPGGNCGHSSHCTCEDGDEDHIVSDNVAKILQCNSLFAWIDSLDAFASFAEIGFAFAKQKEIYIGVDSSLEPLLRDSDRHGDDYYGHDHELWYLHTMAQLSGGSLGYFDDVQSMHDWFFPLTDAEKKCDELCLGSRKRVVLVGGDPIDSRICRTFDHYETDESHTHRGAGAIDFVFGTETEYAASAARSARFEHGESGAT